ncbi:hypothetical protein [Streptomyces tardus]|nr:hypothetical protein [Streptomyces tardus]
MPALYGLSAAARAVEAAETVLKRGERGCQPWDDSLEAAAPGPG